MLWFKYEKGREEKRKKEKSLAELVFFRSAKTHPSRLALCSGGCPKDVCGRVGVSPNVVQPGRGVPGVFGFLDGLHKGSRWGAHGTEATAGTRAQSTERSWHDLERCLKNLALRGTRLARKRLAFLVRLSRRAGGAGPSGLPDSGH